MFDFKDYVVNDSSKKRSALMQGLQFKNQQHNYLIPLQIPRRRYVIRKCDFVANRLAVQALASN